MALLNSWKQIINDQSSIFKIEVGEKIGLKHTYRDINHLPIHGSVSPTQYKCRAKTEQTNTGGHGHLMWCHFLPLIVSQYQKYFRSRPVTRISITTTLSTEIPTVTTLHSLLCVSAAAEIPAPGVIISWSPQLPVMSRTTEKWMPCYYQPLARPGVSPAGHNDLCQLQVASLFTLLSTCGVAG